MLFLKQSNMRVITFSTIFPKSHPKAGAHTFFVEKICKGMGVLKYETAEILNWKVYHECKPKGHTIRGGNRWKVGDWFSPRVWSGKPYASKQIQFAPPIQLKKIWTFEWNIMTVLLNGRPINNFEIEEIANNDGLVYTDFKDWFNIHPKKKQEIFEGQILCWNENINY
jgi:hypothetical protein